MNCIFKKKEVEKVKVEDLKVGEVFLVCGLDTIPYLKVKQLEDGSISYVNLNTGFSYKEIKNNEIRRIDSSSLTIVE